jgi:hypothetical protein
MSGTELLSFRLRIARTEADVLAACRVRAESYGRRLPGMREIMEVPDSIDGAAGVCILLCVDKRSGEPVGTLRLQPSFSGPLLIESSVTLPEGLSDAARVELTRFAVVPGSDPLVRHALIKAAFLYCRAAQVRMLVIGARSRALIRLYEGIGFSNAFGEGAMFPLKHAGDIPHMVLVNDLADIETRWRSGAHAWLGFMLETWHPDIDLFSARPALASVEVPARQELEAA